MTKQLELFPELALGLVSNLDEEIEKHVRTIPEDLREIARKSFRCGALMVLSDLIDLLKKYTDLHES